MRQAWELFAVQGFEATTVDQIADAAGMSRRTFFRYFDGKDELVLERLVEAGDRIAAALARRPAEDSPWRAMREAFTETVVVQETHDSRARPLQLMLRDEPALRAVLLERRRRWEQLLVPMIAQRLPGGRAGSGPDPRAHAIVGSALSCLEAAQEMWAEHPGRRLGPLLDEAMGAVCPFDEQPR